MFEAYLPDHLRQIWGNGGEIPYAEIRAAYERMYDAGACPRPVPVQVKVAYVDD